MGRVAERIATGLSVVVAAGFGALLAVIGAFWQSGVVVLGTVLVPIGLLAALLLTWVGARVTGTITQGRAAAVAVAIGWVVTVIVLTATTKAGDIVVPATWYGYAFLIGGLLIVVAVAIRAAPLIPAPSDRPASRR